MQKLYELRRYVKFDLYTVGKSYVLQLFELDVEPNDLDISCIWENDNYNKYESHLKTVYIVLGILAILSYYLVL